MEDPLVSHLSSQLMDRYNGLTKSLLRLGDQLRTGNHKVWVPMPLNEPTDHGAMLDRTVRAYLDIWYEGEQDGRETRSYPGLIGVPAKTYRLAELVNEAKTDFQAAVQALQDQDRRSWRKIHEELPASNHQIRDLLSMTGLGRLHLKQAYRHIPLLESKPSKVGFSWYTSGKSIKRISIKEAEKLLLQLSTHSQHIQIQLEKLASLPKKESLARIQTLAPIVRANLVHSVDDNDGGDKMKEGKKEKPEKVDRKAMNVSLPIMFPLRKNEAMPLHNEISLEPPTERTRLRRSDVKTEDEPFLPSIRVYKYR